MGSPRPSEEMPTGLHDGPQIEWIDEGSQGAGGSATIEADGRRRQKVRVAAIAMLCLAGGLAVASFAAAETPTEPNSQSAGEDGRGTTSPGRQSTPAPVPRVVQDAPIIDQLASAPVEWLDGLLLGWIDVDGQINLRSLESGEDLDVGVLAATTLPPLPAHVHLMGAPNSTWLLDLEDTQRSGKLSNTVRILRFGREVDSYGFSSTTVDGTTEFFVGSLWGPAMNGLAQVDERHDVMYVPNGGIVVSGYDGTSSIVVGDGLQPIPSRLGRIVAANPETLAGIHCDGLGRCVGRIAGWAGEREVEVDAELLAESIVRLSPDGRFIVSGGTSTWSILDVQSGIHATLPMAVALNESAVWSVDSTTVFLVEDGALVGARLVEDGVLKENVSVARVRSIGEIKPRLQGSDIVVFEEMEVA